MKTQLSSLAPASIETELLVVFAIDKADKKDKNADPQLALLTPDEAVTTAAAEGGERRICRGKRETVLLHHPGGLKGGSLADRRPGQAHHRRSCATRLARRSASPSRAASVNSRCCFPTATDFPAINTARAAVEGAIVGDFDPDTYRSDRKDQSIESVTLLAPGGAAELSTAGLQGRRHHRRESQNFARALVNEPGNKLTPTEFGQRAAAMAKEIGLACEVYSTDKLHELKMGAFWSVSQGSDEPPALIVMRYEPAEHRRMARCSAWWARASPSTPAASPSSPPTTWRR